MISRNRFDDDEDDDRKDTEITLGIGSLLGIFFALVLLCGLFFGFGYTLGHGRSPLHVHNPSAATPEASPASGTSSLMPTGSKPAAQQSAPPPAPAQPDSTQASASTSTTTGASITNNSGNTQPATQPTNTQPPTQQQASVTQQARPSQAATPGAAEQVFQAAVPRTPTQVAAERHYMVQVAAVSRPQDASVLVAALQHRGFHATSRTEAQDHLMHIQIGPFASLAAANQMRSRLMADGYNAILKR